MQTTVRVLANFGLSQSRTNRFVVEQSIWRTDGLINNDGNGLDWFESALPEVRRRFSEYNSNSFIEVQQSAVKSAQPLVGLDCQLVKEVDTDQRM